MKNKNGLQTKVRIMTVATDLFLEKGFYEVTFQKIAKGAKVTQPAIYRHFRDMDELILESCRHWIQEFREYKVKPESDFAPAVDQLQNFLERHLSYADKNRAKDALLFGLYYYSMRSESMLEFYQEIKKRALTKLRMILHVGNLDGSWSIKDLDDAANTIHSVIVGEVIKCLIEPKLESQSHRIDRVVRHMELLLKTKPNRK